MKRTILERAKLAQRLAKGTTDPAWEQFPRDWTAFNAISSVGRSPGDSESAAIDRVISKHFDSATASACLTDIPSDAVERLLRLPPGDDRYTPSDTRYRTKTRALARQFASSTDAVEKLSALIRIVYQVRCNMVHGEKDPDFWRDQSLVRACASITTAFLHHIIRILGA